MNRLQRRILQMFVDLGGDITDDGDVSDFIRHVEMSMSLLPPAVRRAVEAAWNAGESDSYDEIAAGIGGRDPLLTSSALRQRVSRGARLIERATQKRYRRPAHHRSNP